MSMSDELFVNAIWKDSCNEINYFHLENYLFLMLDEYRSCLAEWNSQSSLETFNWNKTVNVRVNITMRRLCTTSCRGKAINILYSESVFVTSVIQHSMCRRHKTLFVAYGSTIKKKLRADWSWGMLAIIRCRIFSLPVCYPKS